MNTLTLGQQVVIKGYPYEVYTNTNGKDYFMKSTGGERNSAIFTILGLNPESFIENIIGYTPKYGAWPTVNTLEDLTKVVDALFKLANKESNIITNQQFTEALNKADICSDWKKKLVNKLGYDLLTTGEVNVSDSLIKEMHADANGDQKEILNELFPNYDNGIVYAKDLKVGEVIEVISDDRRNEAWLMRINSVNCTLVN